MGKRRRQRRRVRNHRPSGNSAREEKEVRPRGKRGRWLWILGPAAIGVSIAGFWIHQYRVTTAALDLLPNPDLSGMEIRVTEKIRTLRAQVQQRPDSATAWGKLAMNLGVHGLKKEAVSVYQQAAKLDAAEFRWPFYCALVLYEMGSPEALEWFEQSRAIRPDDVPLLLFHAQALFDAGRLEISDQTFRRAMELDPSSSHAYLGLARIALGRGDLPGSQGYLLKALDIHPGHGEAHGLLAEVYRRLKMPKDAERELLLAQRLPKVTPVSSPLSVELAGGGREFRLVSKTRPRIYGQKVAMTELRKNSKWPWMPIPTPRFTTTWGWLSSI